MPININLKKDFYWSAGQRWGWKGAGVGIKLDLLGTDDIIRVKSKYGTYEINGKEALELVKKYNSTQLAGQTTMLGIVPINAFKRLYDTLPNN